VAVEEQSAETKPEPVNAPPSTLDLARPDPAQEVPRLEDLLTAMQKGQPLVAADPSTNGTTP
jgi:hypothetical protein